MQAETYTLAVLCSIHVAACSAVAAALFYPIAGMGVAAILAVVAFAALDVARRISRAYHRRRKQLLNAMSGAAAGD